MWMTVWFHVYNSRIDKLIWIKWIPMYPLGIKKHTHKTIKTDKDSVLRQIDVRCLWIDVTVLTYLVRQKYKIL